MASGSADNQTHAIFNRRIRCLRRLIMHFTFSPARVGAIAVVWSTIWGVGRGESFPVSIRVDVGQKQGELKPIWRFFGADEPNYAYMPNGAKLLSRLGELAPEQVYFRTHNLLTSGDGTPALKWGSTNAYLEDANGRPIYDWTILDQIFDAYQAAGVRPYAQIGFMPKDLSTHPEPYQHAWYPGARYEEIYTGWAYPPKNYQKWEELVYQWVKHCVDRYGKEAVETWYWQTWNEADIGYWRGRPRSESFHRLHDHAVAAVRRALPTARVGGPDSAFDGRFLRDFLDHCLYGVNFATGETGTPLDFVSFHAKGNPSLEDGHLRMGISQQLRGINNSFEIIASYPELKETPIVIGESDPDGCAACKATEYPQYGYRNGAQYASYTAASFARKHDLAARHGVNLAGALTWAFTFENQPYFAGFRSLATNGIDKPVLNVFRMLSKMRGGRVAVHSDHAVPLDEILRRGVRGRPDVSALASVDGERISVLVWHYHDDGTPGDDAAVQLAIDGLAMPNSSAPLRHYRIDDRHSNAYTLWKEMGEPQDPTADQFTQLERAGQLAQLVAPERAAVSDGRVSVEFVLPRQAVSLVVLEFDSWDKSAESRGDETDEQRGGQGSELPPTRGVSGRDDDAHLEEMEPSTDAPRAGEASPDSDEPLELALIEPQPNPIGRIAARYRADRSSLERFYSALESHKAQSRMRQFYLDWLTALTKLPAESLSDADYRVLGELKDEMVQALAEMEERSRADAEAEPLVPFASTILSLAEDRQHVRRVNPQQAAAQVSEVSRQIDALQRAPDGDAVADTLHATPETRRHAASYVERLRSHLERWYDFYNGYDPAFTWWMRAPYDEANKKLAEYAAALRRDGESASVGTGERSESNSDSEVASGRDVPDLAELIDEQPTRMQRIVERFQSALRRQRGRRGARGRQRDADETAAGQTRRDRGDRDGESRGDGEDGEDREDGENSERSGGDDTREEREAQERAARAADARTRRTLALRKWQSALVEVDFDDLAAHERVEFLLLRNYIEHELFRLQRSAAQSELGRPEPVDNSGIAGRPIGREALLAELKHEMIAYSPEELLDIAEREYAWCQAELRRAAQEMGLGDDWRAAVEKVKTMHVAPGEQPYLIHSLARETIDYLKQHDLVTVPPIAAETWRMQMMSPERQRINPFFTGGTTISVSFPTDTMPHEAKLQSMRGNNIPFARATVHHELIPGHNLQAFMNARFATHRRMFATPFWGEGWALYWEMLLYGRGYARTPEDRVGFLVWRQHRCARIIFSLSYHLERMKPIECIDFLVDKVGFERNNSAAEVRRSIENAEPLYQAAYMLGGLQFRALHRELVESGKMTPRDFHDAVLREGSMPVVMVRALLTHESLSRADVPCWRFYEVDTDE
jgi:xylan 1,4-beta-xylosidase